MKFEDFLKNSAVFITLTTAFFYCCSSFYIDGYFKVLGLDSYVLERNFHSIVFDGFAISLNKSVTIFYLFVVIFWVRAIYISEVSKITKIYSNLRRCAEFRRKIYNALKFKGKYSYLPSKEYFSLAFRILMLFVFFFAIVITFKSYQADGFNDAMYIKNHIVEEISEKQKATSFATKEHPFKMVTSLKAELNQPLYLLYCGSRMCAGFDLESEEVVYFPQGGYRLKRGLASFQ
ncbi:hypothetical protein [Shewanella xiamenensis]|uniref:hypothetical protein n=1 Tax=Shewanella xiamenensis TaxID=332186 RepID=UPI00313E0386